MKTKYYIKMLMCFSLLATFSCIQAADLRWFGVGNGNWNDNSKWRFSNGIPCGCIPTSADDVQLFNGIVTIPNGVTADARTVQVHSDAELHIGTNSLTVSVLNVGPANDRGVIVEQGGLLAIHTKDELNIEGVTSSLTSLSAVRNRGSFNLISSNSQLNILNCGADGIHNEGAGSVFSNNGVVTIDNLVLSGSDGIFNGINGIFRNEATGLITINDISDSQSEGIDNRYTFENFGRIDVTDIQDASGVSTAIRLNAIFTNHGTLNISNIQSRGIWVHTDGRFNNLPSGKINIQDIIGNDAIEALHTFDNDGLITIDNVDGTNAKGIDSRNVFFNSGTISIQNIDDSHALYNTSIFINEDEGLIDIDFFDDEGLRNEVNGLFTNDGTISIHQNRSASGSHGMYNFGSFTNNGAITVEDIFGNQSEGIYNQGEIDGDFGKFTVTNVTDSGILNTPDGRFIVSDGNVNISDADIGIENLGDMDFSGTGSIINSSDYGIVNDGSNTKLNLINGNFEINGSGIAALSIDGLLTINDCFELRIFDKIELNANTVVTNNGFLFQNYIGINGSFGSSTIINNGVVEDRHQSFRTAVTLWTHNGLYAGPLEGHYSLGIRSQGVLLGKGMGLTKSSTYFIQSSLVNGAGTVQGTINEWVPSEIVDVVYMQVSNGCLTKVIRQDLENQVLFGCESVPVADRRINYDPIDASRGWFFPYNWDKNQVPSFCTDVDIDNPYSITVDPSYRGMGKTLDVEVGAVLDIPGELQIQNFDQ